jgi:hypothetical protein
LQRFPSDSISLIGFRVIWKVFGKKIQQQYRKAGTGEVAGNAGTHNAASQNGYLFDKTSLHSGDGSFPFPTKLAKKNSP